MSYRYSGSVSAGEGFLICAGTLLAVGAFGVVGRVVGKAVKSIFSSDTSQMSKCKRRPRPSPQKEAAGFCDSCYGPLQAGRVLVFKDVHIAGVILTGGSACCENCLYNLRQKAADQGRRAKIVRRQSANYDGQRLPVRFGREITTIEFRSPGKAKKELELLAMEQGCTQIIEVDTHEEIEYCSDGSTVTWTWASGVI